jgi:hypothetical protein
MGYALMVCIVLLISSRDDCPRCPTPGLSYQNCSLDTLWKLSDSMKLSLSERKQECFSWLSIDNLLSSRSPGIRQRFKRSSNPVKEVLLNKIGKSWETFPQVGIDLLPSSSQQDTI